MRSRHHAMPSFKPRRYRMHLLRPAALIYCAGALGCAMSDQAASDSTRGDGNFGAGASPFLDGSLALSDAAVPHADSAGGGGDVTLRVLHALPNLGLARVCHFATFTPDDPTTATNELAPGALPGHVLVSMGELADGLSYGEMSAAVRIAPLASGAITLHRVPQAAPSDGGILDAGAFFGRDGGTFFGDAGAGLDGGAPSDSAAPAAPLDPCDPGTVEAFLPLPLPANWLAPAPSAPAPQPDDGGTALRDAGSNDASLTPEETLHSRGITSVLRSGTNVMLIASGLLLDERALVSRAAQARSAWLGKHPDEPALADQAARDARSETEIAFGPRLVASELHADSQPGKAALSLVHLIADVAPAVAGNSPATLRVCITENGEESRAVPSVDQAPIGFRERILLGSGYAPDARHRVRVFIADDLARVNEECATTSQAPVASLDIPAGELHADAAYTLALTGLVAPEAVCGALATPTLARPGCAMAGDAGIDRSARLTLLAE